MFFLRFLPFSSLKEAKKWMPESLPDKPQTNFAAIRNTINLTVMKMIMDGVYPVSGLDVTVWSLMSAVGVSGQRKEY